MAKQFFLFALLLSCMGMATTHAQRLEWFSRDSIDWSGQILPYDLALDAAGNLLESGQVTDTVDLDPRPGTSTIASEAFYLRSFDPNGAFQWASAFSGPMPYFTLTGMAADPMGGAYLVGQYLFTLDFDPGPASNLIHASRQTLFMLHLDNQGNFDWVDTLVLADTMGTTCTSLTTDQAGNLLISGNMHNTIDFQPGPGVTALTSGGISPFVAKYNRLGALIWARNFPTTGTSTAEAVEIGPGGEVFVCGNLGGTVDFDPGPGQQLSTYTSGGYVVKLDASGNLLWADEFESSTSASVHQMGADAQGGIWIGLATGAYVDIDPGPAVQTLVNQSNFNVFALAHLDMSGNLLWAQSLQLTNGIGYLRDLEVDAAGRVLVSGFVRGIGDLDIGAGVFPVSNTGATNPFIYALSPTGTMEKLFFYPSPQDAELLSLVSDDDGTWYFAGNYIGPVDFDPSPATQIYTPYNGAIESFRFCLETDSCAGFFVTLAGVVDPTCAGGPGMAAASVHGGTAPMSFQWNTIPPTLDTICALNSPGIYYFSAGDSNGCIAQTGVLAGGSSIIGGFDLGQSAFCNSLRPGFTSYLFLNTWNATCDTLAADYEFVLDSHLVYLSSSPAPSAVNGDTLRWAIPPMTVGQPFAPIVQVFTTVTTPNLAWLRCHASITPSVGDLHPLNNAMAYDFQVLASYDPNDKQVQPRGICDAHYTQNGDPLTYTVRFQNVGSVDAINIHVDDTLDAALDLASVRVLAYSHAMHTEIVDSHILRFVFNEIHLPDSGTDEVGSHGYVVFEVHPNPNVATGTMVHNGSAIYFDFNAAVLTNVVMNTLVDSLPVTAATFASAQVCWGDSYTFPDGYTIHNIVAPVTHASTFLGVGGCDSVHTVTVVPNNVQASVSQNGFMLTASPPGAVYQWVTCPGMLAIPAATNQTYTPSVAGTYAVLVSQNSCVDTSNCLNVTVVSSASPTQPLQCRIQPNPTNGRFILTLETQRMDPIRMSISTLQGVEVMHRDVSGGGEQAFDLPDLAAGMYILEVEQGGLRTQLRLMKE